MKVRVFETYPQVRRFTENKDLTRVLAVVQNTRRVITSVSGLEPMIFMFLWNNMKKNEFALIFNEETKELYGYVSKNENGIPQRYKSEEKLFFDDMYSTVEEQGEQK